MDEQTRIVNDLVVELRKGLVVLSVLTVLGAPRYGYQLAKDLEQEGIPMDTNTLYPLLRRLESQGMLRSTWDTQDNKPRKYYHRTDLGEAVLGQLWMQWQDMGRAMARLHQGG